MLGPDEALLYLVTIADGVGYIAKLTGQPGDEVARLPSVQRWREGPRDRPYDINRDASRTEMRSLVCAQCHVEYYCSSSFKLTFPWGKGLNVEQAGALWNETTLADGERFYDRKHKETKAPILKAQHPEFELWSQGIHARSGVAIR